MANYKLLLADDSITIQKVVNLTFADEGIEVITVGDGISALEKFSDFTPDLVMADINMPGISGYEICERIKQTEQTRHIPVILLVGSFEPFDEERAQSVGADDYLTKPFQSIRQLVNKVTELLAASSAKSKGERLEDGEEYQTGATDSAESEFESSQTASSLSESEENYQVQNATVQSLGDTGMDDEMIQTKQAENFAAFDETQKFTTKGEFDEDFGQENAYASSEDSHGKESYQATGFDTEEKSRQNEYFYNDERESSSDRVYDNENYQSSEIKAESPSQPQTVEKEEFYSQKSENKPSASSSTFNSDWEFDEMNLLELPFDENTADRKENLPQAEAPARGGTQPEIQKQPSDYKESEPSSAASENQFVSEEASAVLGVSGANLSQSDIDAIAERVAVKVADMLAKRMSEERLKE